MIAELARISEFISYAIVIAYLAAVGILTVGYWIYDLVRTVVCPTKYDLMDY